MEEKKPKEQRDFPGDFSEVSAGLWESPEVSGGLRKARKKRWKPRRIWNAEGEKEKRDKREEGGGKEASLLRGGAVGRSAGLARVTPGRAEGRSGPQEEKGGDGKSGSISGSRTSRIVMGTQILVGG